MHLDVREIDRMIDDDYTLIAQQQLRDHCFEMLIFVGLTHLVIKKGKISHLCKCVY